MITLHFLQLLANDGFGTIDEDLFFEKLPATKDGGEIATGVAIYSRGFPVTRGVRLAQNFDLYSRGVDDLAGADILERIREFMESNYASACTLPEIPEEVLADYENKEYNKVVILPTGNVENLGMDENDRVIFRLSGQLKYTKVRS